ncbi:MAG: hypothetical protein ACOH17_12545 [Cellulomonas sp.]
MRLSAGTRDAVRELWSIGAQHGRVPSPTPEVDPWEEADPLDPPVDEAVVEFPGAPDISVHLFGDLADSVTVDQNIYFETPRADTLALVAALLAGRARRRPVARKGPGFVRVLRQAWLGDVLVVPLASGKVYQQRVLYQPDGHGWMLSLPEVAG